MFKYNKIYNHTTIHYKNLLQFDKIHILCNQSYRKCNGLR